MSHFKTKSDIQDIAEAKFADYEFQSIKKDVTHFSGDVRTGDIERPLTGGFRFIYLFQA